MPENPVTRRSLVAWLAALPLGAALLPRALRAALASLREARRHLDLAAPDKGGHRVGAIAHVDAAIKETQAGMAFDATH